MSTSGTALSRSERAALCTSAVAVGPEAPTLCAGWTVRDLVAHLLVRERSPAAVGIAVPLLSRVNDAEMRRVARRDFSANVEKVRTGPPRFSPYAIPRLETLLNSLEFFVHHEDIRRAQPQWSARELGDDAEKRLWSMIRTAGKGLARGTTVGVTVENATTGSTARLASGDGEVTVRGLPSEVTLFLFGRKQEARVELLGDDGAVARLSGADLGI